LRTRVAIIAPSRREQEVHDMEAETQVARTALFIQEAASGNAADVALLGDAGLELVGFDEKMVIGFLQLHGWRSLLLAFEQRDKKDGNDESDYRCCLARRDHAAHSLWHLVGPRLHYMLRI